MFINTSSLISETNNKGIQYYILDDGRIWSLQEVKFVSEVPEGEYFDHCHAVDGKSSVEVLSNHLKRNNYPLGELKTDEEFASEVRSKRDKLLSETDYMMMKDYPLSSEKEQQLAEYRQQLRDITKQPGFPRQITWPEKP